MPDPWSISARQRLGALAAILAIAVAVGLAFGRILMGPAATGRLIGVGIVAGLLAWATERRGMLTATVASALGLLLAMTWLTVFHTTRFGLPTPTSLRTLVALAAQLAGQAREYVSPAPATSTLVLACAIAVWAAVFSCYALAFRAESPVLGLVPPLALIVFADIMLDGRERPIYGLVFLLAALGVLLTDSFRRVRGWGAVWETTGERRSTRLGIARNARRVGLTAVAVAAFAPLLLPGFGSRLSIHVSGPGGGGLRHTIHLSSLVSIGAILRDPNAATTELFRVRTSDPSYVRMQTLDRFDGSTWSANTGIPVEVLSAGVIQGAPGSWTSSSATITVTSDDLGDDLLVSPADPSVIDIDRPVSWDSASSSLALDSPPSAGLTYTVTAVRPDPRPADLAVAPIEAQRDEVAPPAGLVPAAVGATALKWTSDATTPYGKVMAIADHFQRFTYDPSVSFGSSPQAMAAFLDAKRGFCQQFAGVMAAMLRELGIPARVAVGFTSGHPVGIDTYSVRAADMHAWVEVPFAGYGWRTFDPTPEVANDPSVRYQPLPAAIGQPCKGKRCERPGDSPGRPRDIPSSVPSPGTEALPAPRMPIVAVIGLSSVAALIAAALAFPLARRSRRRRRIGAARDPRALILATYDVFGERAGDLGWPRSPGETPEEFRRRLDEHAPLDLMSSAHLDRMTVAVVGAAYGPRMPDAAATTDVATDAGEVLHSLREATSLPRRVRGHYRWIGAARESRARPNG